MRQETIGVTQALLESAKDEFLKYGFYDASLRRISANTGVSTNSIYTRFGDKSGLFTAVVKPVADSLMQIYLESIEEASNFVSAKAVADIGYNGTELVLKYIYDNFDICNLIFCQSVGTEYEHYFDKLAEIEEKFYKSYINQFAKDKEKVNDFFIHVICRTGWQYVYEIISHEIPYNEAKIFMKNLNEFLSAGWERIIDLP